MLHENKSFRRFGYKTYRGGQVTEDYIGTDRIQNVWSSGDLSDFEPWILNITNKHPNVRVLLFRCDGIMSVGPNEESAHFLKSHDDSSMIVIGSCIHRDLFLYTKIRCMSLPVPFTKMFLTPSSYECDTPSTIPKAIWIGSTNGIYAELDYQGSRRNIALAVRDCPFIDYYFCSETCHLDSGVFGISLSKRTMTIQEQASYKLILCIDGWGFPGNLVWVLTHTNSVPVICTDFVMGMFETHLIPWVHYVPAKTDGSDIVQNVERALTTCDLCKMSTDLRATMKLHFTPEKLHNAFVDTFESLINY